MFVSRAFTAVTLAATAAATTALAAAPAHAGGAPDLGTVTVDRRAALTADGVTLSGTYACNVPDGATASGPGTLGFEIITRSGVATAGSIAVTCDGLSRSWTITAPAGSVRPGRATALAYLEVCDAEGNCPRNGFEAPVQVWRG